MAEILRVESLGHRFANGNWGLRGVSLSLNQGDFMVLLGPNGSGKSLLTRHLVGLCRPTEGRVLYRGRPLNSCLQEARKAIGLVFQDAESQIIGQSVAEDVAFGPENLGLGRAEIDERVRRAMDAVELTALATRRPDSLSGGERRRLAIAGVLAMGAECLVLDEPFANLDLHSIRLVNRTLASLKSEGISLLVLTHEVEKVLAMAHRFAVMDLGALVADLPVQAAPEFDFEAHGVWNPIRAGLSLESLVWD